MRTFRLLAIPAAICALAVFIVGCESSDTDDSASDDSGATTNATSNATNDLAVTISPASSHIAAGSINIVTFTAGGGDSNYTWTIRSGLLGSLYPAHEICLYQSTTNIGTNLISVADSAGHSASAIIVQKVQSN